MTRHSHKLLLAAVLSGFSALSHATVDAGCHGNSGGSYGGSRSSSHSYSHSPYSSPVYSQPVHQHSVYRQPVYSQPSYPQHVYSQPSYPQSGYPQQTAYPQSSYGQSPPVYGQQPQFRQQPQQLPQTQQAPMLQPLQQSQQLTSQPQLQLQQQTQVAQSQVPGGTIQPNAGQLNVQPNAGQPNVAQSVGTPQNPALTNPAPTQVAQAPTSTTTPTNGSTTSVNDAQQSALQALGGFAPPQTATTQAAVQVPQTQQPAFAGTWTANLSNGARVQLLLQADGNFSWTAVNKDGQSSSFQGTYNMDSGNLSLSRSTDGQKLSGSLTNSSSDKFTFKLSDAQSSSLDFVRG